MLNEENVFKVPKFKCVNVYVKNLAISPPRGIVKVMYAHSLTFFAL